MSDQEIQRTFDSLLNHSPIDSEMLKRAAALIEQLRPDSSLRQQLAAELAAFKSNIEPRISDEELRERFAKGGGRPLREILADLGKSA